MGWEKLSRNYKIIVFTRDQILLDEMAEYFGNVEGITIVNLLHMDERLAEKFIDEYSIDVAFIEEESVSSVPVCKIIEKASADSRGAITHFVLRYDDQCAVKMLHFGESLLEKKLPLTQFRLDDEEDIGILLQTIHSLLIGRDQREKRQIEQLKQELSGLQNIAREQYFKAKHCFEENGNDGGEQVLHCCPGARASLTANTPSVFL